MYVGTKRVWRASCPKNIFVPAEKTDPLYVIDGTFRVFLVPGLKNIFAPLLINVGTNRKMLVPPSKIIFMPDEKLSPYMLMTVHFAFRWYRPKIFFAPYILMSAQIAFSSYRGSKIFLPPNS